MEQQQKYRRAGGVLWGCGVTECVKYRIDTQLVHTRVLIWNGMIVVNYHKNILTIVGKVQIKRDVTR